MENFCRSFGQDMKFIIYIVVVHDFVRAFTRR